MHMKNPFFNALTTSRWNDSALLFLRIFVGAMMLTHGLYKIQNFDFLVSNFPDPLGFGNATSLTLITLTEVGCSFLIIMGLLVRLATLPLIFGMFTAAFLSYPGHTFTQSELSLAYMGIYVFLLIAGGGKYSLDWLFFSWRR